MENKVKFKDKTIKTYAPAEIAGMLWEAKQKYEASEQVGFDALNKNRLLKLENKQLQQKLDGVREDLRKVENQLSLFIMDGRVDQFFITDSLKDIKQALERLNK